MENEKKYSLDVFASKNRALKSKNNGECPLTSKKKIEDN